MLTGKAEQKAARYSQRGGDAQENRLLTFRRTRHVEIHAVLVVFLGSGGNVEGRERNLLRVLRGEVKQGLGDDRVIVYFLFVLIAENQHRGRRGFVEFLVLSMLARWRGRHPGIEILIALLPHPLLIETLLIHLVGQASLVLLVIVERRTRIRPPIGIVETRVSPPISTHASVAVVVAVPPGAVGPESHATTVEPTIKAAVEASRGECRTGSRTTCERTRCGTCARPRTANRLSARVAGEPATVRRKAPGMAATTGRMASAVLRRKRHRSQQESERRDENWPIHSF